MTSGTRVWDRRFTVQTKWSDCSCVVTNSSATIGEYRSKTWSGANSARSTPTVVSPPQRFEYLVPYEFRRRNGSKVIRYKKVSKLIRPRTPKPFNTLGAGENAYSMTAITKSDNLYTIVNKCLTPIAPCFSTSYKAYLSTENLSFVATQKWTANDDIALINKLGSNIQGEDFNLAVFLGEGKESLKTITDGATRIYKALKSLKKGNPVKAFDDLLGGRPNITIYRNKRPRRTDVIDSHRVTQTWFADNWLALQYGWRPILNDVYGAAAHLAYLQNRPSVQRYRAKRQVAGVAGSPSGSQTVKGTVYTRKSIVAVVSHVNEASLAGLRDPASLAWEMLPYSFVADWFIPIGGYLRASQISSALTAKYVTSTKIYRDHTHTEGVGTNYGFTADFLHQYVDFTRVISTTLSIPRPVFKGLNKVASWSHATSAVALLTRFFH